MKNNKKTIIIVSIILGVLVLTIGLTYAMLSISKTGQNSSLIVGDVYMHYANGSKSINLANTMPSDTYDATSFFEFTIDGKNTTTNKDIWYEIILKHGDDVTGKTRIKDNLLKFTLTETKDGKTTTVVDGRSYKDLTSKRIWVNTINKNTTSEVSITYRLYMWVSNDTKIGNVDQDYTMDEWKDIFASIKVDVAGDFNEKILTTDEACFTTEFDKTYQVNSNMTTDELNKCITYVTNWSWDDGETPEAFCKGTGTNYGITFQDRLNDNLTNSEFLIYSEANDIIISNIVGIGITNYDASCGSDVVIPNTIKGYQVTIIGRDENGAAGSFASKNLTSVVIPNSITTIEYSAFFNNQLTNVTFTLPSKLEKIDNDAFTNNNITSVTIPDSVTYLSCAAFDSTVSIIKNDSLTCEKPPR